MMYAKISESTAQKEQELAQAYANMFPCSVEKTYQLIRKLRRSIEDTMRFGIDVMSINIVVPDKVQVQAAIDQLWKYKGIEYIVQSIVKMKHPVTRQWNEAVCYRRTSDETCSSYVRMRDEFQERFTYLGEENDECGEKK